MSPGVAKLGMKVHVVKYFEAYPSLQGRKGTITEIVTQIQDAEDDALVFTPFESKASYPVNASDIELI